MAQSELTVSTQPVLLTRQDAAEMMAMSLRSFERYVQPEIRLVRLGEMRLVPVAELQRWAEKSAINIPG